ncbi:MAG: glycosyltransferase family 2 protein [Tepidisphaerales bacterium]
MSEPRLAIVIVNYATAALAVDCLRSLATERERDPAMASRWHVVVADNASPDDSADVLEKAVSDNGWGAWCRVARLPRNGGFAYGNNAVIAPSLAARDGTTHFWLLNPDTTVRPGSVSELMSYLSREDSAAIVGTRVENPDGSLRRSAFRFPTALGELEAALAFGPVSRLLSRWVIAPPDVAAGAAVDWASGASLVVRRAVLEECGLLDEGFFMYYEETDLCRRARQRGHQCVYLGKAPVVHLVGQASGVTAAATRTTKRRPSYWFESRRRYFVKHHGLLYALFADVCWVVGLLVGRGLAWLRRKPWGQPPGLVPDLIRVCYWKV